MAARKAKKFRQLFAAEAGFDAHAAVVTTDGVSVDEVAEEGEPGAKAASAPGLAGDNDAGGGVEVMAEGGEIVRGEVMEKQVGDDERVVGPTIEGARVGAVPGEVAGPGGGGRREVEGGEAVGGGEATVAGAEFEAGRGGGEEGREGGAPPVVGAEDAVKEAKVAAAVAGSGGIGWERIEQLGREDAAHRGRVRRGAGASNRGDVTREQSNPIGYFGLGGDCVVKGEGLLTELSLLITRAASIVGAAQF